MTLSKTLPILLFSVLLLCGCEGKKVVEKPKKEPIFGKTTQDIGEYDPAAGKEVSDGKYEINLLTTAMGNAQALGPAMENIVKPQIKQAIEMYRATTGEYPETYQEFMDEVIVKNNVQLPMLPHGSSYEYDVANHELIVVKEKKEEK